MIVAEQPLRYSCTVYVLEPILITVPVDQNGYKNFEFKLAVNFMIFQLLQHLVRNGRGRLEFG